VSTPVIVALFLLVGCCCIATVSVLLIVIDIRWMLQAHGDYLRRIQDGVREIHLAVGAHLTRKERRSDR
jgi:hypothetical protein